MKIAVLGLGRTGLSCLRYLAAQGYELLAMDQAEVVQPAEFKAIPWLCGQQAQPQILSTVDLIVLSPGIAPDSPWLAPAHRADIPIIGDIELFAQACQKPIIAITGSNGKSTVTDLLGLMAKQAGMDAGVGGNLGIPALDLLSQDHELYILELSSFQLETTYSLQTQAAVVLNISPDHLDRHHSLPNYAQIKSKIYQGTQNCIINLDDPWGRRLCSDWQSAFSLKAQDEPYIFNRRQDHLAQGKEKLLPVSDLKLVGQHQQANALAALALGQAAGLPMEAMLSALKQYRGLPHRTQWVACKHGVDWYNDSKGTNPGATLAAVQGLQSDQGELILIAGGLAKGADFADLGRALAGHLKSAILFGTDAAKLAKALSPYLPVQQVDDLSEAVQRAAQIARAGDKVLFSPACASFDQFRNYQHRGECFMQQVQAL